MIAELHDAFAQDFRATPCQWSGHNLTRMLRATGEPPARVAHYRTALERLGIGTDREVPAQWGVFDHGDFWARDGVPSIIVGHPYGISDEQRALLHVLARVPGLRVGVDDRPSYYGHGSNHVRIELTEARPPRNAPRIPPQTGADKYLAWVAFCEEFGADNT